MAERTDPINHIVEIKGQLGRLQEAMDTSQRENASNKEALEQIRDGMRTIEHRLSRMPDEEHKDHHDYIGVLLKREEQRLEMRAAVLQKLYSGGAWAAFAALMGLFWQGIKHKFGTE